MNAATEIAAFVDDLSARWTDAVLELLKASGVKAVTVAMELEAWRTLKEILQSAVRWQPEFPPVPLDDTKEEVLLRTALCVARKFESGTENRVPLWNKSPCGVKPSSRSGFFQRASAVAS